MIQKFVDRFMDRKSALEEKLKSKHPKTYRDVVRSVIEMLGSDNEYDDEPDPERIHEIDDGHYQGTLLFVIAEKGYQPSTYWGVKVYYGSCSGCDTLESIRGWEDEPPNKEQIKDYMTLCLHIVQGLKEI